MSRAARPVPAIVVGVVDTGEDHRIVRLLTPDRGRVSALARHARRSRRRFGGTLEPGNRVDVLLRPGRGDLHHLDGAERVDDRPAARRDPVVLALLLHTCEVAAALAREAHPEPRLFGLLDVAGLLLGSAAAPPSRLFRLAFEAKALTFAGIAPALGRCVQCGRALGEEEREAVFAPAHGGAAHAACLPGHAPAPRAWLEAVERGRRTPLRELLDAPCPDGPAWALAEAVEAHAGRALRSRRVLASLSAAA